MVCLDGEGWGVGVGVGPQSSYGVFGWRGSRGKGMGMISCNLVWMFFRGEGFERITHF